MSSFRLLADGKKILERCVLEGTRANSQPTIGVIVKKVAMSSESGEFWADEGVDEIFECRVHSGSIVKPIEDVVRNPVECLKCWGGLLEGAGP